MPIRYKIQKFDTIITVTVKFSLRGGNAKRLTTCDKLRLAVGDQLLQESDNIIIKSVGQHGLCHAQVNKCNLTVAKFTAI